MLDLETPKSFDVKWYYSKIFYTTESVREEHLKFLVTLISNYLMDSNLVSGSALLKEGSVR